MDTLADHLTLEEFVASASNSESNMTMHHIDTMANNSTESASLGIPTPHGGAALGSLSPSSTDTSLDKTTGRGIASFAKIFHFFRDIFFLFSQKVLLIIDYFLYFIFDVQAMKC